MSIFTRFAKDRRGNIALILGLALFPLVGAVGFAIDYTRLNQIRGKLGDALDAGVLSVGSQPQTTDAKTYAAINNWIGAHMGAETESHWHLEFGGAGHHLRQDHGEGLGQCRHDACPHGRRRQRADQPDQRGGAHHGQGRDRAGPRQYRLDEGDKAASLKDAASKLVNSLSAATKDPNDLRIALVPFTMTVNVGPTYQSASWIDKDGISDASNEVFNKKVSRFDLFAKQKTTWAGCVESRKQPYDIDETTGDSGQAGHALRPLLRPRRARHQVGHLRRLYQQLSQGHGARHGQEGDAAASLLPGLPAAAGRHRQIQRHRHQDRHAIGRHGLQIRPQCRLRARPARSASPPTPHR